MRRIATIALTAAGALVAAGSVQAADPVPDAVYAGVTKQGPAFEVELRTAETGRRIARAKIEWRTARCEGVNDPAQATTRLRGVRVRDDDTFLATGRRIRTLPADGQFAGGTQVERYRFAGAFTSDQRARGTFWVTVAIRDTSGDVVTTCVRRSVGWRADRLGVIDGEN
jgi:hypothetical protein